MTEATGPSAEAMDAALAAILPAGSLFAVGGRVRDEIRSRIDGRPRPPKDLDYVVTGLSLEALVGRLREAGRADVVGASFAVVKWTMDGRTVDVALPRRERSTGTHHRDFVVEAGPKITLEEDLARRDFRMNMMARRIADGLLVDPYGGAEDVRAGRIDLLRARAFEEDALRMLRAAQFAARFEYVVRDETMDAMRTAAPLAATISPERVRDELLKLVDLAVRPSIGFEILRRGGILAVILPEIVEGVDVEQNVFHAYDVYGHLLATLDAVPAGSSERRLAALLHDVAKPRTKDGPHFYGHAELGAEMAAEILGRLRFPTDVTRRVTALVAHHMYTTDPVQGNAAIRRFIARIGPDALADQFALRAADIAGSGLPKRDDANERFEARVFAELHRRPAFGIRDLTVDGHDAIGVLDEALSDAGRPPARGRGSADVGTLLRNALERVLDDPLANERAVLLESMRRDAKGLVSGRVQAAGDPDTAPSISPIL